MSRTFLTARWSNLCIISYAVPADVLTPHLPPGLVLDSLSDQHFISLVAFDFLDTRVLGIPWPGFRDFPEINLRFYVRQGDQRGVVFIREYVPQHLVAWIAQAIYNEPYVATRMSSSVTDEPAQIKVEHTVQQANHSHSIQVIGEKPTVQPAESSIEHFFKGERSGIISPAP